MYTVHLAKEPFKFSCSHFTILSSDRSERLHGHNYQIKVDISVLDLDSNLGMAFDFNIVKPIIRDLCMQLDERILLPARSPYLNIDQDENVKVRFAHKEYVFPKEDTICLPLVNVTCEELARHMGQELVGQLRTSAMWKKVKTVRVDIEETRGQSVSYLIEQ